MKLCHKYDPKTFLFVEDVILEADLTASLDAPKTYTLPKNTTFIQPVGFHTPKYEKSTDSWIEGDPVAALDNQKNSKKSVVDDDYQTAIDAGVTYSGALFQSDAKSIATLSETLTALANGWTLPTGFVWIDAANTPHPADIVFLKGLSSALANHKSTLFARLQTAKASIAAATTTAEVDAVTF